MLKHPAFHIDVATCTGCKTCMIACKDKNDLPDGVRWRRVSEYAGGGWVRRADNTLTQDVFAYYVSVACNHCDEPICVSVCPTTAMHKDESGIVLVDATKCIGCHYCEWACPYRAPQFNAAAGVMTKCNFCIDYQRDGKPPACVAACPTRSLTFGEHDDLRKQFGESELMAPLPDPAVTKPNLLVTPGRTAKPMGSASGSIRNPEEV
jgi:anaerobic dimethyl sulfoxide reductase subunit B (iron-sulfur subunit)